jgi:hypothetical protein
LGETASGRTWSVSKSVYGLSLCGTFRTARAHCTSAVRDVVDVDGEVGALPLHAATAASDKLQAPST